MRRAPDMTVQYTRPLRPWQGPRRCCGAFNERGEVERAGRRQTVPPTGTTSVTAAPAGSGRSTEGRERLVTVRGGTELRVASRRQVLMRTMIASSRELQAPSTASLADLARLATYGRTLSPPPAMKGSHVSHRPHAAPPWEGRSAGRRSAWDDCGKARRPPADPGPSPGRWR